MEFWQQSVHDFQKKMKKVFEQLYVLRIINTQESFKDNWSLFQVNKLKHEQKLILV